MHLRTFIQSLKLMVTAASTSSAIKLAILRTSVLKTSAMRTLTSLMFA
jgi:hypothetical protein